MEVDSPARYEMKARQLRTELRAQEQRVGAAALRVRSESERRDELAARFNKVRCRLGAEGRVEGQSVKESAHRVSALAGMLRRDGRALTAAEGRLGKLRGELHEVLRAKLLTERRIGVCDDRVATALSDRLLAREMGEMEELAEMKAAVGITVRKAPGYDEDVEIREIDEDREDESDEVGEAGESDADVLVTPDNSVSPTIEGDSTPTFEGGQRHAPSQEFAQGNQGGSSQGGPNEGESRSVGSSTDAPARNATVTADQFAQYISDISRFDGALGEGLALTYLTAHGRSLRLTIQGGGALPVRLSIDADSARDRRVLWGESREILQKLKEGGVNVAQVRVGAAADSRKGAR